MRWWNNIVRIINTFFILLLLLLVFFVLPQADSFSAMKKKMATNNIINKSDVRIELFFQSNDDLRRRVQFLSSKGYTKFNIVNKNNKDTLIEWVDVVRHELPNSSQICIHYSAKYNKSRQKDGAFHLYQGFMNEMKTKEEEEEEEEGGNNNNEVLLITGSGDKGKFNSLSGLEYLASKESHEQGQEETIASTPIIAVAFNPFFPDRSAYEEERNRLKKKLATKQVSKVYLQFGTDLQRLRTALDWLTTELDNNNNNNNDLEICGSIFLPTKRLINQQKFRPWNGVFLSQEFLSSEESAKGIVLEMIRLYQSYKCEIVIEAPGVRNEKDVAIVESLLQDVKEQDNNNNNSSNDVVDVADNSPSSMKDSTATTTKATSSQKHDDEIDSTQDAKIKRRRIERLISPSPHVTPESLHKPAILLFGTHDVRLHDNEAFQLASCHTNVIPVFLWCRQEQGGKWGVSGAAEVVLKDALKNLHATLSANGLKLICRSTTIDLQQELAQLCVECGAKTVYWNKEHTPESRIREQQFKATLESINVQPVECQSSLMYDPTELSLSGGFNGGHWGTLMPFLKACKKQLGECEPRRPIQRHETFSILQGMKGPTGWPDSMPIDNLDIAVITGKDKWDEPILDRFPMSEDDALKTMNKFFTPTRDEGGGFQRYEKDRSRADIDCSTSKLSAHLRIGTLSPNEFYYKIEDSFLDYDERKTISRRLFWRDLAYFQLLNFPKMRETSIRKHYDQAEWVTGEEERKRFEAWKKGQTGYPLIDAGMRELWATGWMTQSIRMVVASFLTEYLRVNWVKGCEWFHYTLVDADSAINAMMWQNAGRSGIDQWNFVMSPVAASQDATGDYTRKWVPELSNLSKPLLHKPWEASPEFLNQSGIVLGETYPHRIVLDLVEERQKTVASVLKMRNNNQEFNDKKGYDLVELPNGAKTVVFTKKEFRVDSNGHVIKAETGWQRNKKSKGAKSKVQRGRRGRQKATLT